MRLAIYRANNKWHFYNDKKKQYRCGRAPLPIDKFDFKNDIFILGNVDYDAPPEPPREDFCVECLKDLHK